MYLTSSQQKRFWREWSAACRAQGWDAAHSWTGLQIDAERHALLKRAGFDSLTAVDRTAGFDKVLAELGRLRDNLNRTTEISDPTIGKARVLRHVIRTELLPCLALYLPAPTSVPPLPKGEGRGEGEGNYLQPAILYLSEVVAGLVRWNVTDRPTRAPTLEDLTAQPTYVRRPPCYELKEGPSQLEQAMMTLNARIDSKRREAGDTVHDMKTKAHVPCNCSICRAASIQHASGPANGITLPGSVPKPKQPDCPF